MARMRAPLAAVMITILAVLATVSPAAAAEAPRWAVVSTSSPTNLVPNSPANEVQEVVVSATGGTFTLATAPTQGVPESPCNHEIPQPTAPIPFNAPASGPGSVQEALESVPCVGSGGVAVTGGPGGTSPYVVTFLGEHAERPVPLMIADSSGLAGAGAIVTEVTRGSFVPSLTVTAINIGGAATDGSTITLEDFLPAALTATGISGFDAYLSGAAENGEGAAPLSCSAPPAVTCTYSGSVDPGDMLIMRIDLDVAEPLAPSELNQVTVSGGSAAQASASTPVTISDTPAAFGAAPGTVIAVASTDQAGTHPNLTTAFTLASREPDALAAQPRDIRFDLPPGLVGSTVGMPRCSMGVIQELEHKPNGCPSDTMVGMAVVTVNTQNGAGGGYGTRVIPVYNIAPAPGEPAAFGFDAIKLPVRLDTSLLPDGEYGVRVAVSGLSQASSGLAAAITTWGVPADHSGPGQDQSLFDLFDGETFGGPDPGQPRLPLLSNPTQCSDPLSAEMSLDSWTNPGVFISSGPVPMGTPTRCDRLLFESSFSMLPDTLQAGAPAGYAFDLKVPQNNEPDGLATPNLKDVKLTLPPGTALSPSGASGLAACSEAQLALHSGEPGGCPAASQLGTVEVRAPAFAEPLPGRLFLAQPQCGPCSGEDAAQGRLARLFLEVASGEGEQAIRVKLEGRAKIDPASGQITTVFENNPQVPFSELRLSLKGGPRASLANPPACGPVASRLDLTPWSSETPLSSESGFEVDEGCQAASQFTPGFNAGVADPIAGAFSPFTVNLSGEDGQQNLARIDTTLPEGELAKLAGVPLCSDAAAATGSCDSASQVGTTTAAVGPGALPLSVPQPGKAPTAVYLAGPYHGAPFSLVVRVPAQAGPFDLGVVVVRAAIHVDPETAQASVVSDPLPQMLDGIPLSYRQLHVEVNRPDFTLNPTSCAPKSVDAALTSAQGTAAGRSSRFQLGECAALGFAPRLHLKLKGGTARAQHPALSATLTYPSRGAYANIARAQVTLPHSEFLDQGHIGTVCTRVQFNEGAGNGADCPAASIYGHARAVTPLLEAPLEGPVYLRSSTHKLPDLVAALNGQIDVALVGKVDTGRTGGIRNSFEVVPDAPVSKFTLTMKGGRKGLLVNSENLCSPQAKTHASADFTAQNGKISDTEPVVKSSCKSGKHKKGHRGHR